MYLEKIVEITNAWWRCSYPPHHASMAYTFGCKSGHREKPSLKGGDCFRGVLKMPVSSGICKGTTAKLSEPCFTGARKWIIGKHILIMRNRKSVKCGDTTKSKWCKNFGREMRNHTPDHILSSIIPDPPIPVLLGITESVEYAIILMYCNESPLVWGTRVPGSCSTNKKHQPHLDSTNCFMCSILALAGPSAWENMGYSTKITKPICRY